MNVDVDIFFFVLVENFILVESFKVFFILILVNIGNELILFDIGVGEGGWFVCGNMWVVLESVGYMLE